MNCSVLIQWTAGKGVPLERRLCDHGAVATISATITMPQKGQLRTLANQSNGLVDNGGGPGRSFFAPF
jgi:hypothetical protein